jgi:hypothetical protein
MVGYVADESVSLPSRERATTLRSTLRNSA